MRLMIVGVTLVCLFGAIQAQSDSDELIKVKDSVKENVSKEMHGWTYRSIEPTQGSRNVIIQQWQVNDIIVGVAVTVQRLDGFSLKQWYGPLAPGIYHLLDRRRLEIGGPWTKDSAELIFEIIP